MTIEIRSVSKVIKGAYVLNDVSMTVGPHSITGLSGINGSGKTMLMRAIAGLIKPTKGEISINGKCLWRDISFPESIGILIENPAFLDSYTGRANLEMIASIKGIVDSERIRSVICAVGLDPEDRKKYKKYSLGMKQRLGIAAAIMELPDIVLLDEPTNALDAQGVDLLKDLVRNEKQRGATVVVTCHDNALLRQLADEIYFMESGRVIRREVIANEEVRHA